MRVVHLITYSDFGGAGLACTRISEAINRLETDSSQVFDKNSSENNFHFFREKPFPEKITKAMFAFDVLNGQVSGLKKKYRFSFSPSRFGREIDKWELIRKSDILHLHWTNQGFLSLDGLKKLAELGKPIVWTLHDMWAFTGGCHYSGDCQHYMQECGECFMCNKPSSNDISRMGYEKKRKVYEILRPNLVSPSTWMDELSHSSSLLGKFPHRVIPNPIDTEIFKPGDRLDRRKKLGWMETDFIIVMNAFKISNERKGFRYLLEALRLIKEQNLIQAKDIHLVIIGEAEPKDFIDIPFKFSIMGYLKDSARIIEINQASDVYATPSLEDNLPNTIMEALACGLPTVAFRVGGIPDLVEHEKTGYLAEPQSAKSFSEGLVCVYNSLKKSDSLNIASRNKAKDKFSYDIIGKQYLNLYTDLLINKDSTK